MSNLRSFNRSRALGLLALFAISVGAAGLAFWLQNWTVWNVHAVDTSTGDVFSWQMTTGLKYVTINSDNTKTPSSTTNTYDWYATLNANGTCDDRCKWLYISYLLQVIGVSIGLATWTLWFCMLVFNALKRCIWASVGIWLTALCQAAACALWVWTTRNDADQVIANIVTIPSGFTLTNMSLKWSYAFGLSLGSACYTLVIMAAYISSVRSNAKISQARSEVAPADFGRTSSKQELPTSKSAAWVV